jgi:autotransporter-associated beta strand protein
MAQTATWNAGSSNWGTAANWLPATVPVSGNGLHLRFFTGTYTSTNNIGPMTLNRLTVSNTGNGTLTLAAAAAANTLTFAGTNPTLDITGLVRFTGFLAGNGTITKVGSGNFIHDSDNAGFTGTIIINEGRFSNWGGNSTTALTNNFNPVSIVVNNGGTYQFGNAGAGDPNLPLTTYITVNTGGTVNWQEGQTFGGFHLQGGRLELTGGAPTTSGSTQQTWTHGSVVGNAYTGTAYNLGGSGIINKTTSGTVTISGSTALNNTGGLRIQDGRVIFSHALNLGTAPLTFGANGTTGTLEYQGATATRAGNITRATGGTGVIQVTDASTILTLTGTQSGSGMLNKTGPGTLHLTGTSTATGLTQVSEGTLRMNPITLSGGINIAAGSTLAVNVGSSTAEFSLPGLYLEDSTSVLALELNTATVPTQALVNVRNNSSFLFADGATLRVSNALPFANGTYTLLDYDGFEIETGLNLQLAGRTLGTLIYDTANTRIQLSITGTDTLKWKGGINGVWDIGTAANVGGTNNWQLVTGGTATNYIQTDTVRFDDTASSYNVQLNAAVNPQSVTVDTAGTYTLAGTGKITGTTGLTKSGLGAFILATDNDYTGGTIVSGGVLQLGQGGAQGSFKGPVTLSDGILAFNRSTLTTFDNVISLFGNNGLRQDGATVTLNSRLALGTSTFSMDGSGTLDVVGGISGTGILNKYGSGTLSLLGDNNFTGTLNIHQGIVQLTDRGAGGDLDAASIAIHNGGTFIFGPDGNPDLPGTTIVTINAGGLFDIQTGESYGGFILNGGEYRASGASSTADTTVVGTSVFDLRAGSLTSAGIGGQLSQSGGGVLAKTTSGTVTVSSGVTFASNLTLQFREGTLAMPFTSVPATGTVTNGTGTPLAGLEFGTASTAGTWQLQGLGTATSSRALSVAAGGGQVEITQPAATLTLSGALTGSGPLVKTGLGTLNLTGSLSSSGLLTASEGTLRVKPGTVPGGLAVGSAATLAVLGDAAPATLSTPTLTLGSNAALLLELNSATLPAVPLFQVTSTGGLSHAGSSTLRLSNSHPFVTGLYTLLDYDGSAITNGFALQMEGRSAGSLIYNTASTSLQANIVQGEEVRWTGSTSALWDVGSGVNVGGSQNWQTKTSLAATNFVQADFIHFEDNASQFNVQLNSAVRPNAITVSASTDYTFSGSGKITGITGLTKSGTGTLTLTTDNDYTGITTISAGQVRLGTGGSKGSLTGPVTLSGGSLVFDRSAAFTHSSAIAINADTSAVAEPPAALRIAGSGDVTLSGILSGAALRPLEMSGTGTLFLRAANTFIGTTVINSGTVSISGTTGLGAATADVIINGGMLQLTASTLGSVSSTGRSITVGPAGATFDFQVAQSFSGNGFFGTGNVVKTGAGRWGVGSNGSTFSGEILIQEGSLLMTSAQLNSARQLTVASGAQFIIDDDAAGTWSLATGGVFTFSGDGGGEGALRQITSNGPTSGNVFTTTFNRDLVLNSPSVLISTETATGTIFTTAAVTGSGALIKQGPGTLRLGAAGTYSGGTEIRAGTLLVTNSTGSATGTGPLTLRSGSTLLGTGSIGSATTIQSGAILQAGTASTRGTLTFTGDTLLQTGSRTDFRLGANGSNDLVVFNTLTLESGAILRILLGYSPVAGDTFNLIDWTTLGSGSDTDWTNNLDLSGAILASQLAWDTSLFNSQGILSIALVPEPSRALLLILGLATFVLRRRRAGTV